MDTYDNPYYRDAVTAVVGSLARYQIQPTDINFEDGMPLGAGGFARVYRGKLSRVIVGHGGMRFRHLEPVAVKELLLEQLDPVRLALRFAREARIWSSLNHQNILSFTGFYININLGEFLLVSPLLERGSLRQRLDVGFIDLSQRWQWVKGATSGLAYLHSSNPAIAHGDLKASNVLLGSLNEPVICDFGLSSVIEDSIHPGLETSEGFKGSIRWCSPELLDGSPRTPGTDMWAYGGLLLEILTGRVPYDRQRSEAHVLRRIMGHICPSPDEYPELPSESPLWDLLDKCWSRDPGERVDIQQCQQMIGSTIPGLRSVRMSEAGRFWAKEATILSYAVSLRGKFVATIQRGPHPEADLVSLWRPDSVSQPRSVYVLRRSLPDGEPFPTVIAFNDNETLLAVAHCGTLNIWSTDAFHWIVSEQHIARSVSMLFVGSDLVLAAGCHTPNTFLPDPLEPPRAELWTNLEPGSAGQLQRRSETTDVAINKMALSPDRSMIGIERHQRSFFWLQSCVLSTAERFYQTLTTSGLFHTVHQEALSLGCPPRAPPPQRQWFWLDNTSIAYEDFRPRQLVTVSATRSVRGNRVLLDLGDTSWKLVGRSDEWLILEETLQREGVNRRHSFHLPTLLSFNTGRRSLEDSSTRPHSRCEYSDTEAEILLHFAGDKVFRDN